MGYSETLGMAREAAKSITVGRELVEEVLARITREELTPKQRDEILDVMARVTMESLTLNARIRGA